MPESSMKISGRTGEQCPESGPYRSSGRAGVVVFFIEGQTFPPDADGSETTWTLVEEDAE